MRAWLSETDLSLMLNSLLSTKERFLLVYCCSRPCLFVQRFNTFTTHCRWPAFMLARCAKYKNRARNGLLTVHFFTDLPDEVCHLSSLLCERTKDPIHALLLTCLMKRCKHCKHAWRSHLKSHCVTTEGNIFPISPATQCNTCTSNSTSFFCIERRFMVLKNGAHVVKTCFF